MRAGWLLLREDNKLSVPGWRAGALKLMFHVGLLPEPAGSPMHVRAKALDGNTRASLMVLSKKKQWTTEPERRGNRGGSASVFKYPANEERSE